MSLSVIIHTKNAASTITRALRSVEFADEIVIIDMESSDETVALARDFTDKIFSHADEGYADPARNFGLAKASHSWILVLDADEELSEDLKQFVLAVQQDQQPQNLKGDVYALPRQNFLFGQWIEHTGWWPDYQIRLFKKGHVSWARGVHRQPDVTGTSITLPAAEKYAIKHYNYSSVDEYINRLNRYTTIKVDENHDNANVPLTGREIIETVNQEFNRRFFAEQGYLDGIHGVSLAFLQSFYQLTEKLKGWQRQGFPPEANAGEAIEALEVWQKSWSYWIADYRVKTSSGVSKWWWMLRRKFKF